MDKTININLGGTLFKVDEEAFNILRDYIQAVNNRFRNTPGGPETIEDIEFRIAEIFRTQKGTAGVITRDNVEAMIATIGKPEDFDADISGESGSGSYRAPKRLYRSPDDSVVSGVCGGLGAYLNTDPVIFRILFVIFAVFGGAGILIYLVLWVAVPPANTETRRREMYGKHYDAVAAGSGISELTNAIGKVFYIILRIFLVIIGSCLVLTGSLLILAFTMIFVFKIPSFTSEGVNLSLSYFPDMLQYVFSQASVTWILILSMVVLILPVIALIYWGVRMIFWFRIKDGIFNLSMLVVWVVAVAALQILVTHEGISFTERSSSISRNTLEQTPDTLYIVSGNKIKNLALDRELKFAKDYSIFADYKRNIYMLPRTRFSISENGACEIEIRKYASGRNRIKAADNADAVSYNYKLRQDSIILDEYFMIPSEKKWTGNKVTINICIPENTVIYMDRETAGLTGRSINVRSRDNGWEYSERSSARIGGRYWTFTEDGLR